MFKTETELQLELFPRNWTENWNGNYVKHSPDVIVHSWNETFTKPR